MKFHIFSSAKIVGEMITPLDSPIESTVLAAKIKLIKIRICSIIICKYIYNFLLSNIIIHKFTVKKEHIFKYYFVEFNGVIKLINTHLKKS